MWKDGEQENIPDKEKASVWTRLPLISIDQLSQYPLLLWLIAKALTSYHYYVHLHAHLQRQSRSAGGELGKLPRSHAGAFSTDPVIRKDVHDCFQGPCQYDSGDEIWGDGCLHSLGQTTRSRVRIVEPWWRCPWFHKHMYDAITPVVPHKAVAEVSKNRNPIGEVSCCESRMAERIHRWTERWLELCFLERLQWLQRSPHHNYGVVQL